MHRSGRRRWPGGGCGRAGLPSYRPVRRWDRWGPRVGSFLLVRWGVGPTRAGVRPGRPVLCGRKRGRSLRAPGRPGVDIARGFGLPLGAARGWTLRSWGGVARVIGGLRGGGRRIGLDGTLRVALLAGIPAAGPGVVAGPAGARGRRVGQGRIAAGCRGRWKSVRVAGLSSDSMVAGSLLSTPPPGRALSQPAAKRERAMPRPSTPRVVKRRFIAERLPKGPPRRGRHPDGTGPRGGK